MQKLNRMKKVLFFIVFICQMAHSQQYTLISGLEKQHQIKRYTLNAKKMYGIDAEIEMYNFLDSAKYFYLITIFPDLENNVIWEEIPFFFIEDKLTPMHNVLEQLDDLPKTKFFKMHRIVKMENDKYFVAKNVLIEKFYRFDYNSPLQVSGSNIINLKQNIMTYQDVKKAYISQFDTYSPMEGTSDHMGTVFIYKAMRAIYLSEIQEKDGEKLYHFWTFDDWSKGTGLYYEQKK